MLWAKAPASPLGTAMPNRRLAVLPRIMSETDRASDAGFSDSRSSVWNTSSTTTHNNSNAGATPIMRLSRLLPPLPPLSPSLYAERPPNADISGSPFPPSEEFRGSSSLSWIGDEFETGAPAKGKQKQREQVTLVDLTFDSTSSPSPSPPSPLASPSVLVDTGTLYVTDDRDFEYAIQLQIQEIQRITAEYEDEQMARHLMMGIDDPSTATAAPRYNLRPKPHRTGTVSNAVAGPSSRPLTTSTTAAVPDPTLKRECMGCFDPIENLAGLQSGCGHHYCLPCVRNMVTASVSDESLFPPKCCNQPLMATFVEGMASAPMPTQKLAAGKKGKGKNKDKDEGVMQIELLGLVLDDSVLKEKMERRWREWSVKGDQRVYCSNPSCAVFLGSTTEFDVGGGELGGEESHLRRTGSTSTSGSGKSLRRVFNTRKSSFPSGDTLPVIARCPACSASTCISCRQSAHAGQTCADNGDTLFWDTVKVKNWHKCPACGAVIEKNGGCNHMVCLCRKSFIYQTDGGG